MQTPSHKFFTLALCAGALAGGAAGCASSSDTTTSPATMQASTSEFPDDAVITTTVSNQLVDDLGIKKESVNVETHQGVVTLTGAVENEQLRTRAASIASGARGVRAVQNQLLLMTNAPARPPQ